MITIFTKSFLGNQKCLDFSARLLDLPAILASALEDIKAPDKIYGVNYL